MKSINKSFLIAVWIIIASSLASCNLPALQASTETPTPPPTLQPSNTPTDSTMSWKTYRNDIYSFTFEYPAIYDESPYKDTCGIRESSDSILLGQQIELLFLDSGGLELPEFTSNLLEDKDWMIESQENKLINNLESATVQYRFGGTNRFGTFTLIKHGETIFAFNFTAGGFCDVPEDQASEPNAYSHMIETFQLDK